MNSYRPTTVVPVLAKLFARLMEQRMTRWAELLNLRGPLQAGYCWDHSTAGQLTTLKTLVRKNMDGTIASFSVALLMLKRPSTQWIGGC